MSLPEVVEPLLQFLLLVAISHEKRMVSEMETSKYQRASTRQLLSALTGGGFFDAGACARTMSLSQMKHR